MRALWTIGFSLFAGTLAADELTTENVSRTDGSTEFSFSGQIPAGPEDYFNVRFELSSERLLDGLSVSVTDFGAATSFPIVGVFLSNYSIDPTGMTPNLTVPAYSGAYAIAPPVLGGPLLDFRFVDLRDGVLPVGPVHAVIQFPPGDPGTLGVGGDSDENPLGGDSKPTERNPFDSSGYTDDGYTTPASTAFRTGEWGLNLNFAVLDEISQTNEGVLRLMVRDGDETGDFHFATTECPRPVGFSIFTPEGDAKWMLFFSSGGVPVQPATKPLSMQQTPSGAFRRVHFRWPEGFGDQEFQFVAVWGVPGSGPIRVTNEVTLYSLPDPIGSWGQWGDDGFDTGWVVSIPSGSSDYFNTYFGDAEAAGVEEIIDFKLAVMDFGTSVTAYPRAGIAPQNSATDPSGNTPDLSIPYVDFPMAFPPLTFVTTAGQMIVHSFEPIDAEDTSPFTHGYIQFPPGDSGLLGVGSDTSGSCIGPFDGWTLDGYQTPAMTLGIPWGMRLGWR